MTHTMDLNGYRDAWRLDEEHGCWCLENVLYTPCPRVPEYQRLSIFVPRPYMRSSGTLSQVGRCGRYTAQTAPVVFFNNSAGYMQMKPSKPGGPRDNGLQYIEQGMVYITCGCRGRESRDAQGMSAGKSPATLVDLKTAIRFLRHNEALLPGNMARVVSVGWSAGGAMSSLLGLTGDNNYFDDLLRENGAFLEESDAVFAAQIYCPIIDLEHADAAYEWMFRTDKTNMDSFAGPSETMTPFKEALSGRLSGRYIDYINSLGLKHPETGQALLLDPNGRGGAFYDYLMDRLSDAASAYLLGLSAKGASTSHSAEEYLSGNQNTGEDRRGWLHWDGERAEIRDLDSYVLRHLRRLKPCTSFDTLTMRSGENQLFGSEQSDFMHFSTDAALAIASLKGSFPEEHGDLFPAFSGLGEDSSLQERIYAVNPLNFIGKGGQNRQAAYFRIRVGARDPHTSFSVSLLLALKLANAGAAVDYKLVWDLPHSEADEPHALTDWIHQLYAKDTAALERKGS